MVPLENSDKFANKFKLKSSRLSNWDYSTPGYYFITICTYNHNNFFGKIIDNKMELFKMGEIVKYELLKTFKIRKNIKLDEWVIMPNHIHLIIQIKNKIINNDFVETPCMASLQLTRETYCLNLDVETPRRDISTDKNIKRTINATNKWQPNSISSIMCQFKSICTKRIKKENLWFSWQPRFHDNIIKNKKEYFLIKKYIQNNIKNWNKDKYYSNS